MLAAVALPASLAFVPNLPSVRARVRVELEALLDDLCAGDVQIDRIERLSLGGVHAAGITVRDAKMRTVLRARWLELGLDLRALLAWKLRFTHGRLEDARIHAISDETMAITLFSALAPPEVEDEAASEGGGLDVAFEHIHVTRAHVYGDVPGLAGLAVVGVEARGDIRFVAGELAVRVSQVRGDLVRPFRHAFTLESARFALDSSPLRMHLVARVAQGSDRLRAKLTYRAPESGKDHLDLKLAMPHVSPELLLDLGLQPAQILLSDLSGHARLSGPLDELALRADLNTDAGPVHVRAKLPERAPFSLQLDLPDLTLDRLIAYAPPIALSATVRMHGEEGSAAVRLDLNASRISLFGIELRNATLQGVYAGERLTVEQAQIALGNGRFQISGWVDADADLSLRVRSRVPDVAADPVIRKTGLRGGLRTDLRVGRTREQTTLDGSVGIERFGLYDVTAKELVAEGKVSFADDLSDLRADVKGASWGTTYLGQAVGDIVYHTRGRSPKFVTDFELLDFFGRSATAKLELTQEGDSYHAVLAPLELAVPEREPWRAHADLTFAPDGIDFHQVWLANGPQRLDVTGRYSYTKEYRVDANLQAFDVGGLRTLLRLDLADLDGRVDGKLALTGVPGQPRIDAQGTLKRGVFLGMSDLELALTLVSVEGRSSVDLELVLPDQSRFSLYAGGEPGAGADWLTQLESGTYQFGLDFENVPFEVARPWLGWLGMEPPPGQLSATVRGAGTLSAPYLDVISKVRGLELQGLPALDIDLAAEHDAKRLLLRELAVADAHGEIASAQGFLEAVLSELVDLSALRASLDKRPLELAVVWKERLLSELPGPLRVDLAMPATGSLRVAQTETGPSFELATRLGWPKGSEGLDACGASRHPEIELNLSAQDLRASGKLITRLDGEQLAMADLEADTPVTPWITGREPLYLPRTSFTLNGATASSEEIPGLCEYIAGPLRIDVTALDAFADPPELQFTVRSGGLQLVAHQSQHQRLGSLRYARSAGRPFALVGAGEVEGESFRFRAALDQGRGSELRVDLSLPRRAIYERAASDRQSWPPARAQIQANKLEVASLLLALPSGLLGSGQLNGGADLRYDFAKDAVAMNGALWVSDGKFELASLGQELSDVEARLVLRDDTVRLERLSARDFDGHIEIGGEFQLRGASELATSLDLAMRDFPVRRESAQVSRLTGGMKLSAVTTASRTRAELSAGELRVNLPNDLGQGLQPLEEHRDVRVRGAMAGETDEDPHSYELHFIARNPPFRVLRSDLTAEIAADLTLRYRAPQLTMTGSAEIKRGSFELYGKRFELGESRLAFDGSEAIDPLVSIDATHRIGSDEIGVHVGGRVSDPTISFSHSNPTITQTGDIIAQLLGARSEQATRDGSQTASGAAASILAGATAGLLTQEVRQEFGGALPVLSLESGSEFKSARIRAGVQLDQLIERRLGPLRRVVRGAYVEGFVAPGASNGEAVNAAAAPQSRGGGLLELRFPKDLVGTVEFRPIQNWRLDVAWEP